MDITKAKPGDLIKIHPAAGPTVTAYDRPEKTNNIGLLNEGEIYVIHKLNEERNMIELEVYHVGWPKSLHPVSYGGVWIDARFAELLGIIPVPEPKPAISPDMVALKSLAGKVGAALTAWSEE